MGRSDAVLGLVCGDLAPAAREVCARGMNSRRRNKEFFVACLRATKVLSVVPVAAGRRPEISAGEQMRFGKVITRRKM
jgi:hypothetical protein